MTLHQLKILMSVAKYLNLRKAAEELHLSQPSVFVQFKNLESEYDLKLYKRNGRGIELTRAGRQFLTYAGEVLAKLENLDEAFKRNGKANKAGALRICGSYGPSIAFLPGLLAKFRTQHPTFLSRLGPMTVKQPSEWFCAMKSTWVSSRILHHLRRLRMSTAGRTHGRVWVAEVFLKLAPDTRGIIDDAVGSVHGSSATQ